MFKLHIGLRRAFSLVMILAVIQAGLLGSGSPLMAEPGNSVFSAVYQDSAPTPGVSDDVYAGGGQGLPAPLIFLQDEQRDHRRGPTGDFTVTGCVYENSTGMPLTGVTVQLMRNGHPTQFSTSTDSQGSYTLSGVGSGLYELTFKHPGFTPEKFEINVSEDDVTQDCNLFRNTSFKGRIVNKLGESLSGAQVTLADQNLKDRNIVLSTNTDGWFYLVDVPPGRYQLTVTHSVYHKQKMVWVDEYPQELELVLAGSEPAKSSVPEKFPASDTEDDATTVPEAVYDENSVGDDRQPGDVNDELPNGTDEFDNQSGEGGDVNNEPNVEDGLNEPPIEDGQVNGNAPNIEDVNIPPIQSEKFPDQISLNYMNKPLKISLDYSPEFLAFREHDPLIELDQLLKKLTAFT